MLVGRNNTRRAYNMRVRQKQNIEDPLPVAGDKLVCLRNNRKKALFNGGLWRVKSRTASRSKSRISHAAVAGRGRRHKVTKVSVRDDCFEGGIEAIPWEQRKPYDEFDYGYVLTVHKSQGSQWDDVVLFDESFAFQDSRARWLYTGITRAAKRLERGGVVLSRAPDAAQRAALAEQCAAEPGPQRNTVPGTVPALRSGMKNAAPRPGHKAA